MVSKEVFCQVDIYPRASAVACLSANVDANVCISFHHTMIAHPTKSDCQIKLWKITLVLQAEFYCQTTIENIALVPQAVLSDHSREYHTGTTEFYCQTTIENITLVLQAIDPSSKNDVPWRTCPCCHQRRWSARSR